MRLICRIRQSKDSGAPYMAGKFVCGKPCNGMGGCAIAPMYRVERAGPNMANPSPHTSSRGIMKYIPLYQPSAPPRPHFLKAWARWALLVAIGIPAIFYGTRAFFWLVVEIAKMLPTGGILP